MSGRVLPLLPIAIPETDIDATKDTKRMGAERIGFVSPDFVFSWLSISGFGAI
jgi:hypothetical protein